MEVVLVFIFGTLIGSFLNVVILRLPKNQTLQGNSHCMVCKRDLRVLDLIPIFSFIALRGQCHYCKAKISPRYLIIETITGLLFVGCWIFFQPTDWPSILAFVKGCVMVSVLLVVFVIDLEHFLILDSVLLTGGLFIVILSFGMDILNHSLFTMGGELAIGIFAALVITIPFYLLWYLSKGRALGFGDVKFAIFLGLALGWPLVLAGVMIAILLGGLVSVLLLAIMDKSLTSRVPFGTFLGVGAILALFFGTKLIDWYLAVLGVNGIM